MVSFDFCFSSKRKIAIYFLLLQLILDLTKLSCTSSSDDSISGSTTVTTATTTEAPTLSQEAPVCEFGTDEEDGTCKSCATTENIESADDVDGQLLGNDEEIEEDQQFEENEEGIEDGYSSEKDAEDNSEEDSEDNSEEDTEEENNLYGDCAVYMSESAAQSGRLGLFAAKEYSVSSSDDNKYIFDPDLAIPLLDVNENEFSPWHDIVWPAHAVFPQTLFESVYFSSAFLPGIASLAACSDHYHNIELDKTQLAVDSVGPTRRLIKYESSGEEAFVYTTSSSTAGSFSYYHGVAYKVVKPIRAGEEIVLPCPYDRQEDGRQKDKTLLHSAARPKVLDLEYLKESSICMERLTIGPSTLSVDNNTSSSSVGRGAFSTRPYQKGEVITSSPVVHFDRSQMDIVYQIDSKSEGEKLRAEIDYTIPSQRAHGMVYFGSQAYSDQVLMNYCFGTKESNVLLLPYGPGVNAINHAPTTVPEKVDEEENEDGEPKQTPTANVAIRWSNHLIAEAQTLWNLRHNPLLNKEANECNGEWLVFEYFATREIDEGGELFMDYGEDWTESWKEHERWRQELNTSSQGERDEEEDYEPAIDYTHNHGGFEAVIRTVEEQQEDPYPGNIMTACFHQRCMHPCSVVSRSVHGESGYTTYSVVLTKIENRGTPSYCNFDDDDEEEDEDGDGTLILNHLPESAIRLVDAPYKSDLWLRNAFRKEITLPDEMKVDAWKSADPSPEGEFLAVPLKPGQMEVIRWAGDSEVVTPNAYRIGLPPSVREVLLEYCNRMGITDILRHVTVEGNGLVPGEEVYLPIDDDMWFLQRPKKFWTSNLHWLSPAGNPAQEDYLQTLSLAGFDDVLKSVGEQLNMDGLVAFHVTFIGVSFAIKGYMHHDVKNSQAKTYNMIIPLILTEDETASPELDLQDAEAPNDDPFYNGRYRYEYDVAAMMGDEAYHGTSAVDYRATKEFRLAATVYIADVNEANVDAIQDEYTQAYPPRDRDLLMSWAGSHWRPDDPSAKLPKATPDHILVREQ